MQNQHSLLCERWRVTCTPTLRSRFYSVSVSKLHKYFEADVCISFVACRYSSINVIRVESQMLLWICTWIVQNLKYIFGIIGNGKGKACVRCRKSMVLAGLKHMWSACVFINDGNTRKYGILVHRCWIVVSPCIHKQWKLARAAPSSGCSICNAYKSCEEIINFYKEGEICSQNLSNTISDIQTFVEMMKLDEKSETGLYTVELHVLSCTLEYPKFRRTTVDWEPNIFRSST